ncbi:hypothetical protein JHK82_012183 [Glycine max]|nr:hypothetical protein JHK86_012185 [Glycine max]KAG5154214.1 hypothetical protein JHK82_012183 [Glycine max]
MIDVAKENPQLAQKLHDVLVESGVVAPPRNLFYKIYDEELETYKEHIKDPLKCSSLITGFVDCLRRFGCLGISGISTETRLPVKPENWLEIKLPKVEPIIEQIRSEALDGVSDSKAATSASEDSNKKDKEFSPIKDDYFKDFGVEPGLGNLQESDTTLDHQINGIGIETRLPIKPQNWPDKNLIEVEHSRSDALNRLSDSKSAINASEDSSQKNKKFGTTEDDYLKDASVEPGIRNHKKLEPATENDTQPKCCSIGC